MRDADGPDLNVKAQGKKDGGGSDDEDQEMASDVADGGWAASWLSMPAQLLTASCGCLAFQHMLTACSCRACGCTRLPA